MDRFGGIGRGASQRERGEGQAPFRSEASARKGVAIGHAPTRETGQKLPPRDPFALSADPEAWGFSVPAADVDSYRFRIRRNRRKGGVSAIEVSERRGRMIEDEGGLRKAKPGWFAFDPGVEIALPKPTPEILALARRILTQDNIVETVNKPLSDSSKQQFGQMTRRLEHLWPAANPVERLMAYKGLYEFGVVERGSYYPVKSAVAHDLLRPAHKTVTRFLGEDGRWLPEIHRVRLPGGQPIDLDKVGAEIVLAAAFARLFPPDPRQQRSRQITRGKAAPEEVATVPTRKVRRREARPLDLEKFGPDDAGKLERALARKRPEGIPVVERITTTTAKRGGLTRNQSRDPQFDLAFWREARRYGPAHMHLPWIAVLQLTGARRSELVKGVEVSLRRLRDVRKDIPESEREDVPLADGELAFVVKGSKCRELPVLDPSQPPKRAGQEERSGKLTATGHPVGEWLLEYVRRRGGEVVIRPDFGPYLARSKDHRVERDRTPAEIATAVTNLCSRISARLGLPDNASPHTFRHLRSAVDKAERLLNVQERSAVLGHAVDETTVGYGYARQGSKGGPPPITQAFASRAVRSKARGPRNAPSGPRP